MIDEQGYRLNVGIIVVNKENKLLWAQRCSNVDAWQFPQGGIKRNESPKQAMYRELHEELGLVEQDVAVLQESSQWYSYDLPKKFQRPHQVPLCIGQKQRWFLLRLLGEDKRVKLNVMSSPEFIRWKWVDYWLPVESVVDFKRDVYMNVLSEFDGFLNKRG